MELKFDPNQEYQVRAVDSVVAILEGQPKRGAEPSFGAGGVAVVPNRLDLTDDGLLENVRTVQQQNGVPQDATLLRIEAEVETAAGKRTANFPNFSVEMETGTGKTYVYLRTALELHRRYGLTKFIVVVPSIAVREGVLKTFAITRTHFDRLFQKTPYNYYGYISTKLNVVRQFARGSTVQFMVMTLDAFNKNANILHQDVRDGWAGPPIQELQAARPILILDEPQNMATDLAKRALASLNPLFALRYSATHREPFNVVYRLTPYDAYRQSLVKKIAVASVVKEDDANQVFLRLDGIEAKGSQLTARVAIHKRMASGAVKETVVLIDDKKKADLEKLAERPEYQGYRVAEISKAGGYVRFGNEVELRLGESRGADREAILREQVRYTVREHFRRQERLRPHGVKVLSLFFVDSVDNYAPEDSPIRAMFRDAFNEQKAAFPAWADKDPNDVQAAYFATKRRKGGQTEFLESSGSSEADAEAFELIMRKKERLLSFEEPTAFIFSHSALKEGWDNPNVFFVCTLRHVGSEMQRRQQVGRGMRLAVNQNGERVRDDGVNLLTVVANEAYERYVESLQNEIRDEYGADGVPPKPVRADQVVAKLYKERQRSPEFEALWARIQQRTRYAVEIDSHAVVAEAVAALSTVSISKPRITITKAEVDVDANDTLVARRGGQDTVEVEQRWPLPNLVDVMADLMEHTSPPVKLTRRTLLEVVRRLPNKQVAVDNPQEFATVAVARMKEILVDGLVRGVRYAPLGEVWEMKLFETEWQEFMEAVATPRRGLYDHVFVQMGVERKFAEDLEKMEEIRIFVKLPRWFKVDTPVGPYNPDWAVVWEERDAGGQPTGKPHLYLVAETKGGSEGNRRRQEQHKVQCGRRHFEQLGAPYLVVDSMEAMVREISRVESSLDAGALASQQSKSV